MNNSNSQIILYLTLFTILCLKCKKTLETICIDFIAFFNINVVIANQIGNLRAIHIQSEITKLSFIYIFD